MSELAAAIGMFDGVHRGHQALVKSLASAAGAEGLKPAVFTFDRHPKELVAPHETPLLLSTLEQRTRWLKEAGASLVVALKFDENLRKLTAREFLSKLKNDYGVQMLMMGYNHLFGSDRIKDFDEYARIGEKEGIKVIRYEEQRLPGCEESLSSSAIRSLLKRGDIERANEMLGRNYAISGHVEHGQGIGHTIGFPTANIRPADHRQLIPADGVYAADCLQHRAVVNIGKRPTVASDGSNSIEAHIIGFEGDLYGQEIETEFLGRLREERKFPSIQDLKEQIQADCKAALTI